MGLTGAPRSTFFYPRIRYGSPAVDIDFDDPATLVGPPQALPIVGINLAEDGTEEALFSRFEYLVQLGLEKLEKTKVDLLWTWFSTHAAKRKTSALTLDRLATTGTQWESSQWNAFFDKAILVNNPFGPGGLARAVLGRPLYNVLFVFRQGG